MPTDLFSITVMLFASCSSENETFQRLYFRNSCSSRMRRLRLCWSDGDCRLSRHMLRRWLSRNADVLLRAARSKRLGRDYQVPIGDKSGGRAKENRSQYSSGGYVSRIKSREEARIVERRVWMGKVQEWKLLRVGIDAGWQTTPSTCRYCII